MKTRYRISLGRVKFTYIPSLHTKMGMRIKRAGDISIKGIGILMWYRVVKTGTSELSFTKVHNG